MSKIPLWRSGRTWKEEEEKLSQKRDLYTSESGREPRERGYETKIPSGFAGIPEENRDSQATRRDCSHLPPILIESSRKRNETVNIRGLLNVTKHAIKTED